MTTISKILVAGAVAGIGLGVKKMTSFINKYSKVEINKSLVGDIDYIKWCDLTHSKWTKDIRTISFKTAPITLSYIEEIPLSSKLVPSNELKCSVCAYRISESLLIIAPEKGYQVDYLDIGCNEISFSEFKSLNQILGLKYICTPFVSCDRMFANLSHLQEIDLTGMNFSMVRSTAHMFDGCSKLKKVVFPDFPMTNLRTTEFMFYECTSLESIYLNMKDEYNLRNSSFMFGLCVNLEHIFGMDDMFAPELYITDGMFCKCKKLKTISFVNWRCNNIISAIGMFMDTNLNSIDVSTWHLYDRSVLKTMFNCVNFNTTVVIRPSVA